MRRRTLLTQFAGAGAAAALAGCIADRPGTEGDDSDAEDGQPGATDDNANQSDDDTTEDGMSSPTLAGTDVTTDGAADEAKDRAEISFGDGTVTVEGTITAPTPQYEAAVKDAEYSEADDEFRVTVTTREKDDDRVSTQPITGIEYTLDASFDGGTPINVAVIHETAGDGTKTVAEDSRR